MGNIGKSKIDEVDIIARFLLLDSFCCLVQVVQHLPFKLPGMLITSKEATVASIEVHDLHESKYLNLICVKLISKQNIDFGFLAPILKFKIYT